MPVILSSYRVYRYVRFGAVTRLEKKWGFGSLEGFTFDLLKLWFLCLVESE
jgi:hypothetical protein